MEKILNPFRKSILICMFSFIAAFGFIALSLCRLDRCRPSRCEFGMATLCCSFYFFDEGWAVGNDLADENNQTGVLLHYSNGAWTSTAPPNVDPDWYLQGVPFHLLQ